MKIWAFGIAVASLALAAPVERSKGAECTTKSQRRAWHKLSREEKKAYIDAEKCLMNTPATLGVPPARTVFDELQFAHVLQTNSVHGVGAFLPFHRFFMYAHEQLLAKHCNYTGGQPYWDESLDAGNFTTSVVLDPDTGFGGNGVAPDNCIKDGPFNGYVNVIGPGQTNTEHCIDRTVNDCMSQIGAPQFVEACMKTTNFSTFWPCLEAAPHSAGHGGIGGEMLNIFSSPGDPLFYLHHTYLDKLWWDWQSKNNSRLTDIAGRNTALPFGGFPPPSGNGSFNGTFPPFGPLPGGANGTLPGNGTFFPPGSGGNCSFFGFPGGPPPFTGVEELGMEETLQSPGDPGNVTTLGHILTVYGAVPNTTIKDVMDIQRGLLCYEYV